MGEDTSLGNHFQKVLWITGYFIKIPTWQDHHGPFMFIVQKGFCGPSVLVKGGGWQRGRQCCLRDPPAGITRRPDSGYSSPVDIIACVFLIVFTHNNPACFFFFWHPGGRSLKKKGKNSLIYILVPTSHLLTSCCLRRLFSFAYLFSSCLECLKIYCRMQIQSHTVRRL